MRERGEPPGGDGSHLQNLQHAQSSEGALLDAADVVLIQLTGQKHR